MQLWVKRYLLPRLYKTLEGIKLDPNKVKGILDNGLTVTTIESIYIEGMVQYC